jgi:hypothetical protein
MLESGAEVRLFPGTVVVLLKPLSGADWDVLLLLVVLAMDLLPFSDV